MTDTITPDDLPYWSRAPHDAPSRVALRESLGLTDTDGPARMPVGGLRPPRVVRRSGVAESAAARPQLELWESA